MDRQLLIDNICSLCAEMEHILVNYAKIKGFDLFNDFDSYDAHELAIINEFLMEFRVDEYQELYRIFRLPLDFNQKDEEGYVLWDRYFKNQRYTLPEMILMRKQGKIARDNFHNIPIKKKPVATEEEDEIEEELEESVNE